MKLSLKINPDKVNVDEKAIKGKRDSLEFLPITVGLASYDVDAVSLERMRRAILKFDDLSMTVVNGEISWTTADNTAVSLSKIDLENVRSTIDLEIAQRSDRLFYHCSLLIDQLPNVIVADISDENWPINA